MCSVLGQTGSAGEDTQAAACLGVCEIKAQILNITFGFFESGEGKAVPLLCKHVLAGR